MKILIQSDIHIEHHKDKGDSYAVELAKLGNEVDVLVLAGDIGTFSTLPWFFKTVCPAFKHVVYVNGNHELYGSSPGDFQSMMMKVGMTHDNFRWLDCAPVTIDGQRFIGGTLWFPDGPNNWQYKRNLSDFYYIRHFDPWVYEQNRCMKDVLEAEVTPNDIVITHHLPHASFISPRFQGEPYNCFFVGGVPMSVVRIPKLWIFGHTHDSIDEVTPWGGRFVCNPYGYQGSELNPHFDSKKIIEI